MSYRSKFRRQKFLSLAKNIVTICRRNFLPGYLRRYIETISAGCSFFKINDTMHTIRHQLQWIYLNSYQFLNQFVQVQLFPPPHLSFQD